MKSSHFNVVAEIMYFWMNHIPQIELPKFWIAMVIEKVLLEKWK